MPDILPSRGLRIGGSALPAWLVLVALAIPLLLGTGAAAALLLWVQATYSFPFDWSPASLRRPSPALLSIGGGAALALAGALAVVMLRGLDRRHQDERRRLAVGRRRTEERRLSEIAGHFPGVIYRRVLYRDGRVSYPYVSPGLDLDLPREPAGGLTDIANRLFHPDDRERWRAAVEESARSLTPFRCEIRLAADGRWMRSAASPHAASDGAVIWDGVLFDVTDLKTTEAALKCSLAEKDDMLREIHHRVRNNLQVVSSLIQIEAFHITDSEARERLGEISRRIGALGHLHEQLYRATDFASIDCAEHILHLCRNVLQPYGARPITLETDLQPLCCDLDTAIPLGLIGHELLHAVNSGLLHCADTGAIQVTLARCGGDVVLSVESNLGDTVDLGHPILHALADQIEARIAAIPGGASLHLDARRFEDQA